MKLVTLAKLAVPEAPGLFQDFYIALNTHLFARCLPHLSSGSKSFQLGSSGETHSSSLKEERPNQFA